MAVPLIAKFRLHVLSIVVSFRLFGTFETYCFAPETLLKRDSPDYRPRLADVPVVIDQQRGKHEKKVRDRVAVEGNIFSEIVVAPFPH
jgi:hypothetical protein